MVTILVHHAESRDNFTRLTVLTWINEFIALGKYKLLSYSADILGVALSCISDPEKEIRQKSEITNSSLLKLVENAETSAVSLHPLLNKVGMEKGEKRNGKEWVSTNLKEYV